MSTVSFEQSTANNGQIFLKLSSSDLPAGQLAFSIHIAYTSGGTQFSEVSFGGESSVNIDANIDNASGSVAISGTLLPSVANFATFVFNASGKGVFDADIASLTINGATPLFVDPPPMNFDVPVLTETLALYAGAAAVGVYNPYTPPYFTSDSVTHAASHGSVVLSNSQFDFVPTKWTYTPQPGFYGLDSFSLEAVQGYQHRAKTFVVHVSPVGTAADDTFHSSAANYTLDGGGGIDRLVFSGVSSDFAIAHTATGFTVADTTGAEGASTLVNVERLRFADTAIALDIAGNGGQAYRLYQAAFDRTPDLAGVGFWIAALDKGIRLSDVAGGFVQSAEFQGIYGANSTHLELVTRFYENILHRAPEQAGLDFWVGVLETHAASEAEVLAGISESNENQLGLIGVIGDGFRYIEYTG